MFKCRTTSNRSTPDVNPPIRKLAILGGESTGKSTLASALAEALDTCCTEEYGRTLWQQQGGRLKYEDMLTVAQTQLEHEDLLALSARDWLLCDTTPMTTLFYSQQWFGKVDPTLRLLSETPYDCTLLCADDFEFVQDGTRQDAGFRRLQNRWYSANLERRGISFLVVQGSVTQRMQQVLAHLARFDGASA